MTTPTPEQINKVKTILNEITNLYPESWRAWCEIDGHDELKIDKEKFAFSAAWGESLRLVREKLLPLLSDEYERGYREGQGKDLNLKDANLDKIINDEV